MCISAVADVTCKYVYKHISFSGFSFRFPASQGTLFIVAMSGIHKGPGAALAGDSYLIPDALFKDINDGSTWTFAISRLSDALKLPGTNFFL